MLFPTSPDHRQTRRQTDCAQVASRLVPSLEPGATVHGHPQQDQRQHSALQTSRSASSVQNLRVSNIVHDTGSRASSTSSQRLNSLGQRPHFYATSAPSSLVNLRPDNRQRTRPPVPLFNNSTGNMSLQTLSHPPPSFLEGKTAPSTSLAGLLLTRSNSDMSPGMFDFPSNFRGITPDLSMVSFDNMGDFDMQASTTPFSPVNQPTSASVSTSLHTVSPKDLLLDTTSAPPSTTMTDLTTPGTNYMESPSCIIGSTDTSPLFANDNLGAEADLWPSLFDDELSHDIDDAGMTSPVLHTHVAPRMSRYGSSPGQPSSRGSHQGAHSSTSGVSAKRRDKPLPAITIDDPTDIIAVKRARNTMAARKSRQKRVERNEELTTLVAELEKKVDHWRQIALDRGYVEH